MAIQGFTQSKTPSSLSWEKKYNFFSLYISILFPPIIRNIIIVCHRLICLQADSRDSVCRQHCVPFYSIFFSK